MITFLISWLEMFFASSLLETNGGGPAHRWIWHIHDVGESTITMQIQKCQALETAQGAPQPSPPHHSFSMLSTTALSSATSPPICKKVDTQNLERIWAGTWGVIRGVETQKLKERRRGKTVSKGFKSSMVTISFLPKLACLLREKGRLMSHIPTVDTVLT